MDELLEHLEKAKLRHQNTSRYLTKCIVLACEKLDKYYSLTDTNPVLYAAVGLHPALKYEYFKYAWAHHSEWIENAKTAVQKLWISQYKSRTPTPPASFSNSVTSTTFPPHDLAYTVSHWRQKHMPHIPVEDELEEFTSTACIVLVQNPREWWAQNQKDYPRLSQMALDILAIPAISSEVERIFSSAGILLDFYYCYYLLICIGLLLTHRRNRIKDDIIEAVKCQKSWFLSGILGFAEVEKLEEVLGQLENSESSPN